MDLESYLSSYTGHTRITRLQLIAKKSPELRDEALRMAFDEVRTTGNVVKFKELWNEFNEGRPYDEATTRWLQESEEKFRQQLAKLEVELNKHRATIISKDSIRISYQEMGALYLAFGDLNNALKAFMRSRDYCTNSAHILHTCLDVINVAIELGNYAFVNNFVSKAEATPDARLSGPASKLRQAGALSLLHGRKFRMTAQRLLECSYDPDAWTKVLTGSDVATYASLCALATFSRSELKSQLVENTNFREFLELAPSVRELVHAFMGSKYAQCIKLLDQLKVMLAVDMHMHEHVADVYKSVEQRMMVQYVMAYQSVNLVSMAQAFVCPVATLEPRIADLVADGLIHARIDSQNKMLYTHVHDAATTCGSRWKQWPSHSSMGHLPSCCGPTVSTMHIASRGHPILVLVPRIPHNLTSMHSLL